MIEQYTIKELVDKYVLFVPEIQRDYIWGHKNNYQKVMIPFLESLDHHLCENQPYNIGFLYSYTNSIEDNYIIDGQQRFTTIILLLYVLSVNEHKDFPSLVQTNKPTMRFTYNVRPQAETFMRKLFESELTNEKEIKNQTWFLPEYETDKTILSMVNGVDSIAKILATLKNITYEKVLNQICFWYFNVEDTSQGEELYITMNSRGQKLTDAEQLKPYLFDSWKKEMKNKNNDVDYGKLWDNWEEMFYSAKGDKDIKAVDNAMNTFLRVVYEMETRTECRDEIPKRNTFLNLPLIARYMEAMQTYAQEEWPKLIDDNNDYRPHRVLKALIAEGLKPEHNPKDAERVKHVFTNIVTRRRYRYSHNDLLSFLAAYSKSRLSFLDFIEENSELINIFDEHELLKIRIYKAFESNTEIEVLFDQMESTKVWQGNITPLVIWSLPEDRSPENFNLDTFKMYSNKFEALFGNDKLDKEDMDITRRALLALEFIDYPRIFHGYTNTCFAKKPEDWHTLLLDERNFQKLKNLFDCYTDNDSLLELINHFPAEKEYSEFVHIPNLLKFCRQKNIQWWYNKCWYLISESRANSQHANIHTYKYYLLCRNKSFGDGWKKMEFYHGEGSCVFIDKDNNTPKSIAIDAYWNGGEGHSQMALEVFLRNSNESEIEYRLRPLRSLDGFIWNGQRYVYYFDTPTDEEKSFQLMDTHLTRTIDYINSTICDA